MRSPRDTNLSAIMETELRLVPVEMDQEAVAYMFRQYALISAPVVDEGGKVHEPHPGAGARQWAVL